MDIQNTADQIFKSQPFSQFMGATLKVISENEVEIGIVLGEQHRQQHGFAHGGVLSYLADNSITFAGGIALMGDALTSEFKINYVKPAQGERLIAKAIAKSVGKKQAVCVAEIYCIHQDREYLCAIAQGTVIKI
ncbi:PaaI family thioesterase [Acinetobacter populi]|uniref:Thioesterase n=1 Tax=Acinetobacter populi TaxID=1582270 RepID=A0A1Z9Z2X5_9GAMM|nr:PaaI family thioesterase [Acinetobacter populi]OUY08796.1 thioesterase [Acinetobacter populi]